MLPGFHRAANFRLNPRGGEVTPIFFVHISSSRVKINLQTVFQLPSLPGSKNASFRLNTFYFIFLGGAGDHNFSVHISYSWVKISLPTTFQLSGLPGRRNARFRLNPIGWKGGGGQVTSIFLFIFLLVGLK